MLFTTIFRITITLSYLLTYCLVPVHLGVSVSVSSKCVSRSAPFCATTWRLYAPSRSTRSRRYSQWTFLTEWVKKTFHEWESYCLNNLALQEKKECERKRSTKAHDAFKKLNEKRIVFFSDWPVNIWRNAEGSMSWLIFFYSSPLHAISAHQPVTLLVSKRYRLVCWDCMKNNDPARITKELYSSPFLSQSPPPPPYPPLFLLLECFSFKHDEAICFTYSPRICNQAQNAQRWQAMNKISHHHFDHLSPCSKSLLSAPMESRCSTWEDAAG